MRDQDVIAVAAEALCRSRAEVRRVHRALVMAIREGLRRDGKVAISTLGTLETRELRPFTWRDAATGAKRTGPPRAEVRFRASTQLETGQLHAFDWRRKAASIRKSIHTCTARCTPAYSKSPSRDLGDGRGSALRWVR